MRSGKRTADRLAFVDAYRFPSSVRQRFSFQHETMAASGLATVEAATRQWFRLAARLPRAKLSMPSVVVDDLWHEFVLHTADYAAFCDAALGRFLHHQPESAMSGQAAAANRSSGLVATLRVAQIDEANSPAGLPLLFRVDQELSVQGGRKYLADCGGRGECYTMPGTLCLRHAAGDDKGPNLSRNRGSDRWNGVPPAAGGAGCGGGCGGGG
jgi:hypothetical protein